MSRRRVVVGVCAIGVGTLVLSGCGFRVASQQFSDDNAVQQTVSAVRIENGSGRVHISVGAKPGVHRTVYYQNDKPAQTSHFEGDTLVLEDCKIRNCSIDYDVVLAAGAKVMGEVGSGEIELTGMSEVGVQAGSGNITVRDVAGPVTVKVSSGRAELSGLGQSAVVEASSGDVRLTDVKGDATVVARSGSVVGTGLSGKTSVQSSSGDVTLTMAASQNVKVTASSGDIRVNVPKGTPYKTSVTTSSGDQRVNVATDPNASTVMELQANSGDVTVDYS
ncbi:DUF4097 family beta strand repeat-containing protein [Actinocrispum wychmicini]|uniref:Putative adhesin n=1 Tax=Actinocrispum wychmicini TaxID=1213861 RepID=A0A4R2JY80_9PSEU|nr:DUF4097 family beta strand repeat-containing protein [Actinocrispum wychmicini]TCO64834.1 putative adhesin [Actinocrispum wychmicini]